MVRILNRQFQQRIPYVDVVLRIMGMLQDQGLGWMCTLKPGNSKVFYKVIPTADFEEKLTMFGIGLLEYQVMFSERDPRLEAHIHDKAKKQYPQLEQLPEYYNY